ncbi:MAG: type II secretion system F family protein [Acidimicrobiales bacterium]
MLLALGPMIGGLAVMITVVLIHRNRQEHLMNELLGMSPAVEHRDDERVSPLTVRAVDIAGQAVVYVDKAGALNRSLQRARIPLRAGEFVIVVAAGSLAVAALLLSATHALVFALAGLIAAPVVAWEFLKIRASQRQKAFEQQLPDALSLVASSLSAGHTFLRAIQMMTEEAAPPLSEEFLRVVNETRLGDPLVDALERMAARLEVRDMDIVVQAIRIQQTVGGRLADLLHTLSEFIRSRDEVRREVKVLTAEGRISAYVLTALVPFLFAVMQVMNPEYAAPLYSGWGLLILVYSFGSVLVGLVVILRMVKIDI